MKRAINTKLISDVWWKKKFANCIPYFICRFYFKGLNLEAIASWWCSGMDCYFSFYRQNFSARLAVNKTCQSYFFTSSTYIALPKLQTSTRPDSSLNLHQSCNKLDATKVKECFKLAMASYTLAASLIQTS